MTGPTSDARVVAVVPCRDEEEAVADVVSGLASAVDLVVVVDNGSRDRTAERARAAGAIVVAEPRAGYGRACRAGLDRALAEGADVVVFCDGDGSDAGALAGQLSAPVVAGRADLVLGVRTDLEPGALPRHAIWGNRLACFILRRRFGVAVHDLAPLKAVSRDALRRALPDHPTYGFTAQLLTRAAARGLVIDEISLPYRRRRGGRSKVAGNLRGSLGASAAILRTVIADR